MVCSCAMSFNCVQLQSIFCSCVNETQFFFFFLQWLLRENGRSIASLIFQRAICDRTIKQWMTSVSAKYRDLSVSRRSIICLRVRLRQIIDLLATCKSRYFPEPRPITVYYLVSSHVKISCYPHMGKHHRCYGFIINRPFQTKTI